MISLAVMKASTGTARTKPGTVLNRSRLDELRRANGITSEAELARIIGTDYTTLWRASKGLPVNGVFIAQVNLAFPHVPLGDLFHAVTSDNLAA
jgi:hypothetical protein